MGLEHLEGRVYGPNELRTCREKVAEFISATQADAARWQEAVPPGFAASTLFAVAPQLLSEVAGSLIHAEQSFRWHGPIPVEEVLVVTGRVGRVRVRGDASFVGFELTVEAGGTSLLDGSSTFIVSPPRRSTDEEEEPRPAARAPVAMPAPSPLPPPGEDVPPLARSASRADLVRYAAATRDWNPIHWDHEAARAAGFPGIVCHGLLQAAWLLEAAARHLPGPSPVGAARFRFKAPLRPSVPAEVHGTARADGGLSLSLVAAGVVTAGAEVAPGNHRG